MRIRFQKLFAVPSIFENPNALVQKYMMAAGVSTDAASHVQLGTVDVVPVDDFGNPSLVAGHGKVSYGGERVLSEYLKDANLEFEYADFGSGLSEDEHVRLWSLGTWEQMRFEIRQFDYWKVSVDLPDPAELYQLLRSRPDPILSSVELPGMSETMFRASVRYLDQQLGMMADRDDRSVEVYSSKTLTPSEKNALEKRLGRESPPFTIHIILSKRPSQ